MASYCLIFDATTDRWSTFTERHGNIGLMQGEYDEGSSSIERSENRLDRTPSGRNSRPADHRLLDSTLKETDPSWIRMLS